MTRTIKVRKYEKEDGTQVSQHTREIESRKASDGSNKPLLKKDSVWMEEWTNAKNSFLKTSEGKEYKYLDEKERNEDENEWDEIWEDDEGVRYTQDEVEDELLSNLKEGNIDTKINEAYGITRTTFFINEEE